LILVICVFSVNTFNLHYKIFINTTDSNQGINLVGDIEHNSL